MIHAPDFAAASLVDRAAHLRDDLVIEDCDAVLVRNGEVAVTDSGLARVSPGAHPPASLAVFLGRAAGTPMVAAVPSDPDLPLPDGTRWVTLRAFLVQASALSQGDLEAELALTAVAITSWHASHGHCPRCGTATRVRKAGWTRECPTCQREHYPRTDPAMIVAITDDADRLLLAHAAHWSAHRYSVLAGFVEPGESLEHAVHREVSEEVGIAVTDVRYLGSQPWPFPGSVMTAFAARAVTTDLNPDLDEITDARWVSRADFMRLVESSEIVPPPVGSIASRMVARWLDAGNGPMPGLGSDVSGA